MSYNIFYTMLYKKLMGQKSYFSYVCKIEKQEKMSDWKDRLNVVFSTNPDYNYSKEDELEEETLDNAKQMLRIELDKRNRKGKSVTLITGFVGTNEDLQTLEKLLKVKCGVGGSSRDGEILLQGDFRKKVLELLLKEGYAKARII